MLQKMGRMDLNLDLTQRAFRGKQDLLCEAQDSLFQEPSKSKKLRYNTCSTFNEILLDNLDQKP